MSRRLVQLANFYAPTSGGLRVAVDRLGAGYRSRGYTTTLIVPGRRTVRRGGQLQLRSPALPNRSGYRVIVSRRAVYRALDEAAPDLIEVHDKLLLRWIRQWADAHGCPVVGVSHERTAAICAEYLPWLGPVVRGKISLAINSHTERACDRLVVCSPAAAAEFTPADTLVTIPLGVDLDHFRPLAAAQPRSVLRLISVGRLSQEKRPDLAIAALERLLRDNVAAELVLVGDGPMLPRLRRQAAALPVRFLGFCEPGQLPALLNSADVAVATGPFETFGLAGLEALACGTALVAINGAATADFVRDQPGAGRAVPADADAIAGAVRELARIDPLLRRQAARGVAERYRWQRTVDAMINVHDQCID